MTHRVRNIDYGVRTFDLGTARDNERIPLKGRHLSVLACDAEATIRLGDQQASGIPARNIQSIKVPHDIENLYLSNPSNAGELVLLNGVEGTEASVPSPSDEVTVTDDSARELGKVRVQDSGGVLVDPAEEQTLASLETKSPSGTTATAAAAGTGSANAAQLNVPDGRSEIELMYDTAGAATITVETSTDGATWYQRTTFAPGSAANNSENLDVGADYVRAYIDANLNSLEISAKGV